jgi:hypothetical protein
MKESRTDDADVEAINVHRMQLSLTKKLTTPNRLTSSQWAECSAAVIELNRRISKLNSDACDDFVDLKQKQKAILRLFDNINHMHEQQTDDTHCEKSNRNDIVNKGNSNGDDATVSIPKCDISGEKARSNTAQQRENRPKVTPAADISSASDSDMQTLLLQQKVGHYNSTATVTIASVLLS